VNVFHHGLFGPIVFNSASKKFLLEQNLLCHHLYEIEAAFFRS
jgi:hypothetical protein